MNVNSDDINLIKQAFALLIIGMGITSVFMYALVLLMQGMAKIVPRFNHLMPDSEENNK